MGAVQVFKPADEEPHAANNPKNGLRSGSSRSGLRKGIRPGEGAAREVAAYLLDHEGFSGVPPTALVSCHTKDGLANALGAAEVKVGSLQVWNLSLCLIDLMIGNFAWQVCVRASACK